MAILGFRNVYKILKQQCFSAKEAGRNAASVPFFCTNVRKVFWVGTPDIGDESPLSGVSILAFDSRPGAGHRMLIAAIRDHAGLGF
jgi:hypothetical protein